MLYPNQPKGIFVKRSNILPFSLLVLAITGCSSVPVPETPGGSDRIPVNTPDKISAYKQRQRTLIYEEKSIETRVEQEQEALRTSQRRTDFPKQLPAPSIERVSVSSPQIEVREQSIVFRVPQEFGKTHFNPSDEIKNELLRASYDSLHIEIRGRTDASRRNAVDDRIAFQRAINARRFLIDNGVSADKIKITFMGYGGYVVSNTTLEGKAKNRRVEIETMDMDTTSYRH